MAEGHKLTMLGTGLIGMFYTMTLHRHRGIDRVQVVYSRTEERAQDICRGMGHTKMDNGPQSRN